MAALRGVQPGHPGHTIGEYGPNDFVPASSTEPETDEKPQYFDGKPMYIEDNPLYVNLRPKPKPIFPQIKIPPFDVLKNLR